MKLFIFIAATLLCASVGEAQSRRSPHTPSTPCTCEQNRALTKQADGTASVCLFPAFGFNGKVSFEGGWHLTGDIVSYMCSGGRYSTPTEIFASEPSPLCSITARNEYSPAAGTCVHQADTNHNGVISSEERLAYDKSLEPVTEGGYAGKASQLAIDNWNLSYGLLISGSNLCDRSRTPREYSACLAKPVECRRLDFIAGTNPVYKTQIKAAFSGYSNSLDHCE